jgi:aminoglycoside phosphotransferase (APT) family kinase protein
MIRGRSSLPTFLVHDVEVLPFEQSATDRGENCLGRSRVDQDTVSVSDDEDANLGARSVVESCVTIDVALVTRLIAGQFPRWSDLSIRPVQPGGWDNKTFHLGADMTVRLPSGGGYAQQVGKEHRWLPTLAVQLPLAIPAPLARGAPGEGYPWSWSVYPWIPGENASVERISDLVVFATDLARFLVALQRVDPRDGPSAGRHSAFRGGPLMTYDGETRRAIAGLADQIPLDRATAVWESALSATAHGAPVWFHGDVAAGNLLVRDGRLAAVIDFGCAGVGDPACDVTIAWTLLSGDSRRAFREVLKVDSAMWARGRGWALWKALITLASQDVPNTMQASEARRVIEEVLSDEAKSN